MAAAELHRGVDVLERGQPALVDADRVEQVGHEQPVHDEGRRVLRLHRRLADGARPLGDRLHGRLVGEDRAHDLDQLHQRHRVEEVHAEHLPRPPGGRRHRRHVARRRVGGEDRVRRTDPVELGERLVLEDLVLGHRLHDEIGGLELLQPRRARDAAQRLVLRLRLELALGHEALERLAQPLEAARDERVVGLDEQHVEAGLRRDLHDAGAHETAADHADVLDGHESFL